MVTGPRRAESDIERVVTLIDARAARSDRWSHRITTGQTRERGWRRVKKAPADLVDGTLPGVEMVEVVNLLSDSDEDEEDVRPAESPLVVRDDPPGVTGRPSAGVRARSDNSPSGSDISDGGFVPAPPQPRSAVGGRSAAERILLGVDVRPPMPPRPSSRRVSDEGGADYSDDSPIMMSMSQTDRARLDKAQERERTRQRKATEKEHERQRKATDKATDRANKEAAKERAKADKAADKRTQQRASGKHKMREVTCVWDTRLGTMGKDFGYMLRAQLKMGVNTNGKVHECLNVSQMLPVERSVTWRYHEPSDEPNGFKVTGLTADVRDGCGFTLVYVPGEDFVEMAWKDHAAAVEAGVRDGDRDAPEPPGGLRSTLRAFKTKLQSHGPNHAISLLVTNVEGACTLRERRDFRTNGAVAGFSKAPIENALARIYARVYVDVRLTAAPDVKMACEHVVNMHRAWAEKPYVQETTVLSILGHNGGKGTAAVQAALEAAFVAGKSAAPDGTIYESQALDSQFSQDVDAGFGHGAGPGVRRKKSPAQVWASALMKIPRLVEKEAIAIVKRYPTMAALMAAYEDPSVSEAEKKKLLKGLDCVGTHAGATSRKVGDVISARVYEMFRPRDDDDVGDQLVAPVTDYRYK